MSAACNEMRLILVRHPAPEIGAGICYGASDVPVSRSALATALASLPSLLPADLGAHAVIYTSPLQRCTALAMPLAQQLGLPPPLVDARLAEMDFGSWEMQPWEAIARADIDAWTDELAHYAPGSGESVLGVAARVAAFIADCRRQHHGDVIVVCHAGTIRMLTALTGSASLLDAALRAASTPHHMDYASVSILRS
jgi:alpha-ribazole phosphatase